LKVEKAKSDYHMACKNEKTAVNQERNANADSSLSQDQVCIEITCSVQILDYVPFPLPPEKILRSSNPV
jgi:hypothetical protein